MPKKSPETPNGHQLSNTGFGYTLAIISGKYRMLILFWLYSNPPVMRFNELQRALGKYAKRKSSLNIPTYHKMKTF